MAQTGKSMKGQAPSRIPWPPLLLVAVFVAGWITQRYAPIAWPATLDPIARGLGFVLVAVALGIIGWAAIEMRRASTTILPTAAATTLVITGPFHFSRNPIYLADSLLLIGLALIFFQPWIALLVPVFAGLITWLAIRPEEQHLEIEFGQIYRDYKVQTRRWL